MKKNDKKTTKNVKNYTKSVKPAKKTFTEEEICSVACMVFLYEVQIARIMAAVGLFLGDELNKHALLKEYCNVDSVARKYSREFSEKIGKLIDCKKPCVEAQEQTLVEGL